MCNRGPIHIPGNCPPGPWIFEPPSAELRAHAERIAKALETMPDEDARVAALRLVEFLLGDFGEASESAAVCESKEET